MSGHQHKFLIEKSVAQKTWKKQSRKQVTQLQFRKRRVGCLGWPQVDNEPKVQHNYYGKASEYNRKPINTSRVS